MVPLLALGMRRAVWFSSFLTNMIETQTRFTQSKPGSYDQKEEEKRLERHNGSHSLPRGRRRGVCGIRKTGWAQFGIWTSHWGPGGILMS